jgi:hypothetical protein
MAHVELSRLAVNKSALYDNILESHREKLRRLSGARRARWGRYVQLSMLFLDVNHVAADHFVECATDAGARRGR